MRRTARKVPCKMLRLQVCHVCETSQYRHPLAAACFVGAVLRFPSDSSLLSELTWRLAEVL